MTTRDCRCLLIILVLGGCQTGRVSTAPPGIDARLASLQTERLAHADPLEDHAPSRAFGPLSLESGTAATEAPTLGEATLGIWTLGDLGDDASLIEEDSEESLWAEKEDLYIRRRPLPSFWATVRRDLEHLPDDLWRDTKRVYGNPVHLAILGAAYGGSLAIQQSGADRTVERHFRSERPFGHERAHRHMSGEWRDVFATAGNPSTHFGLAGLFYLAGQQTMDDKTYEVGKTLLSALTINGVTVMIGQAATWDRGPGGEVGTMPSGHTSSSFVVASVLHEAYGHAVGIPLYALAVLNAHERLESKEHYLSDVIMGGVLGTLVGHAVASGRDPEFFGWKIVPWASPGRGTGIGFMKTLP